MKQPDYIVSLMLALGFHGVLLTTVAGLWRGEVVSARPLFQQGDSSLAMTFVAPPAQEESVAPPKGPPPSAVPVYSEPETKEKAPSIFIPPMPSIFPMPLAKLIAPPENRPVPKQPPAAVEDEPADTKKDDPAGDVVPSTEYAKLTSDASPGAASSGQGHGAAGAQSDADALSKGIGNGIHSVGDVRPVYPMGARLRGEQGNVIVRVSVGADGRVNEREVTQSSGFRELDQSALKAIGRASFAPARKNGEPITSETLITFRFKLEDR